MELLRWAELHSFLFLICVTNFLSPNRTIEFVTESGYKITLLTANYSLSLLMCVIDNGIMSIPWQLRSTMIK